MTPEFYALPCRLSSFVWWNANYSYCLLQASGVTVSDACKTTYEEIKKDKKHRYVVFYIKDEKQIDVEVIGKTCHSFSV